MVCCTCRKMECRSGERLDLLVPLRVAGFPFLPRAAVVPSRAVARRRGLDYVPSGEHVQEAVGRAAPALLPPTREARANSSEGT